MSEFQPVIKSHTYTIPQSNNGENIETAKKTSGPSAKTKSRKATVEDASDDEDYKPPKNPHKEPALPGRIFDGNGKEESEFTEAGAELVRTQNPLSAYRATNSVATPL